MKKLLVAMAILVAVGVSCAPYIKQDVSVDKLLDNGFCTYEVTTHIWTGFLGKIIYSSYIFGIKAYDLETAVITEENKAKEIINSGCFEWAEAMN